VYAISFSVFAALLPRQRWIPTREALFPRQRWIPSVMAIPMSIPLKVSAIATPMSVPAPVPATRLASDADCELMIVDLRPSTSSPPLYVQSGVEVEMDKPMEAAAKAVPDLLCLTNTVEEDGLKKDVVALCIAQHLPPLPHRGLTRKPSHSSPLRLQSERHSCKNESSVSSLFLNMKKACSVQLPCSMCGGGGEGVGGGGVGLSVKAGDGDGGDGDEAGHGLSVYTR